MPADVRELTRDAVRARLAEAVFGHFVTVGFDASTVEEAATAAGISRATFFRYFRSKEDAVIAALPPNPAGFAGLLRSLDTRRDEPTWTLMRRVFEASVDGEADPERVRAKARLITGIPSLRAHLAERRAAQEHLLAEAIGERVDDPLTARVLAATSLAAFDLAWREWAATPDASFRTVIRAVFSRVSDSVAGV